MLADELYGPGHEANPVAWEIVGGDGTVQSLQTAAATTYQGKWVVHVRWCSPVNCVPWSGQRWSSYGCLGGVCVGGERANTVKLRCDGLGVGRGCQNPNSANDRRNVPWKP